MKLCLFGNCSRGEPMAWQPHLPLGQESSRFAVSHRVPALAVFDAEVGTPSRQIAATFCERFHFRSEVQCHSLGQQVGVDKYALSRQNFPTLLLAHSSQICVIGFFTPAAEQGAKLRSSRSRPRRRVAYGLSIVCALVSGSTIIIIANTIGPRLLHQRA